MSKETLNIIGAGLAGSLLSIFLAKRGYTVNVYERAQDMRIRANDEGRSINLALAHRGIRALQKAGIFNYIKPFMIPMEGRQIHNDDGTDTFQPYGNKWSEVIYSLSRAELNKQLMTAAEDTGKVTFFFEHECKDIVFDDPDAYIKLLDRKYQKSIELVAKHTFACDGAGSRIRRKLFNIGQLSNQDVLLDHDYKELTIPANEGNIHQIKSAALHIWPRGQFMLIALPNQDGSFTVTLFLPKQGKESFAQLTDEISIQKFFASRFPNALPYLPNLIEEFIENPQGLLGTVYTNPFHWEDKILLVGDSSHAIVPFHGQGMNSAFEDCTLIDELLEQHDNDWGTVFREFSLQRKDDADAIAKMALENYITMRDSVRHPDFHLRKKVSWELENQFPKRFIPRYSMVMFHHIPYAECLRRGEIQESILATLTEDISDVNELDLAAAQTLIESHLEKIDQRFLVN